MRSLKFDFELRRHISFFTVDTKRVIFVCYFYNITIAIMSDNRGSEVMLYFTDEVFCLLANHNRGHGIFYKAGLR